MNRRILPAAGFAAALLATMPWSQARAQEACAFRGALDDAYCDANRDMVADVPTDAARQRDPSTLVFAYTPVEDPALYASQCVGVVRNEHGLAAALALAV